MSIGKKYSEGNRGNDLSFRSKVLRGLQGVFDNTDQVEGILEQILLTLGGLLEENKLDFEMKSVKDANGDVFQLRGTLDEETGIYKWDYIDAEGNAYDIGDPGGPVAPVVFLNPDGLLTAILTELEGFNDKFITEVDDDAIAVEQAFPTFINLLYGAFEGEGTEWERIQTDGDGRLKGIQDIIDELQSTLDVNITNATLAVTQSGAWTVTSNQGTSPWVISGTVALDAATLAALETITVNQGTNPWTVNGTVNAAQSGVWTVALDAATLTALETITVEQGTSPWVVSSVDLDIRDLTFATDKVDASGSDVNSRTQDGSGTGITSTVVGLDTGLDVNVIGGAVLDVNLDQNNDQVQVYGSDLTAPIATDTAGHLQVDIVTIPEVEVKNDVGNPIPISDAGGSLTVDATDLDIRDLSSTTDSVEVLQDTHDDLNANANIQVGDVDVSAANPVPVSLPSGVAQGMYRSKLTNTTTIVNAGATSMAFINVSDVAATFTDAGSNVTTIEPGEEFAFEAAENNTLGSVTVVTPLNCTVVWVAVY